MKRLRESSLTLVALLLVALTSPLFLRQTTQAAEPSLIISEIKIRNDTAGLDEFIELYNPTAEAVVLNDFFIGYVNSPAPTADQTFSTAVIGDGLLEPGQSLVLAKDELDPNLPNAKKSPFSSLSDSGGSIRLTNLDEEIIDEFAWTSTASASSPTIQYLCTSSTTSCNLNKTQSFQRGKDAEENYLPSEPSWQLGVPTPESSVLTALPVPTPEPEPELEAEEAVPTENLETEEAALAEADTATLLLAPQITELFPNPAPPASDATDEFIELYNPNTEPIDLTGYRLESGNTFTYKFTFGETVLQPFEYKAFLVAETGAILSNSGSQARLINPNGSVVAQSTVYSSADEGDAWAFVNGGWQWTTTPTPNATNVLTAAPLKVAAAKTAAAKATKKPAKKAAAKKKVAAAKKTKKSAAAAAQRQIYEDPTQTVASLHPGVLAGVGLLTVVYAAYEYRHDVANRLQQLRRYREIRRAARPQSSGR